MGLIRDKHSKMELIVFGHKSLQLQLPVTVKIQALLKVESPNPSPFFHCEDKKVLLLSRVPGPTTDPKTPFFSRSKLSQTPLHSKC